MQVLNFLANTVFFFIRLHALPFEHISYIISLHAFHTLPLHTLFIHYPSNTFHTLSLHTLFIYCPSNTFHKLSLHYFSYIFPSHTFHTLPQEFQVFTGKASNNVETRLRIGACWSQRMTRKAKNMTRWLINQHFSAPSFRTCGSLLCRSHF